MKKLLLIFGIGIMGCEGSDGGFEQLEEPAALVDRDSAELKPLTIDRYTPEDETVVMVEKTEQTFAVYVSGSDPETIKYSYYLDDNLLEETELPFYKLTGAGLGTGRHDFKVVASNGPFSAEHTFALRKNTLPAVVSRTAADGSINIQCLGGTKDFEIEAADADGDSMTFEWKIAGITPDGVFEVTESTDTKSKVTFTPNCAFTGPQTLSVEIFDGFETSTETWNVEITNPTEAQITDFTPSIDPVVIPSTGSQTFSYTGVGKPPLTYEWYYDGTLVVGSTTSQFVINAPDTTAGDHTLKALLKDSDSEDEVILTVRVNAPPVIANESPATTVAKINHASFRSFSIDASDVNVTDSLTYTWLLNDVPSSYIASSDSPTGSSAIFDPDSSLVGSHTLKVIVSDGLEQDEHSWTVEVNYFSSVCNNLEAGQICTLVGRPGIGSGTHVVDDGNSEIRIHPGQVNFDTDGNMVIADQINDVIWYYNRTLTDQNVVGQNVPAGQIMVVAGSGAEGYPADGITALNWDLHDPAAAWFDIASNMLFVADQTSDDIIRYDSSGNGIRIAGVGSSHVDGDPAQSHRCDQPGGVVYDVNTDELFVSCYRDDRIKRFHPATTSNAADIDGYIYVGNGGTSDGTVGAAGSAQTNGPFGLTLAPNGDIYFAEHDGCRARVIHRGTGTSFYGTDNLAVAADSVLSLAGIANSCDTTVDVGYASVRFDNPHAIAPYFDDAAGTNLLGFFVTSTDDHRVVFVNNSGGDLVIGGTTVADKEGGRVFGSGVANYNGDGALAANSNLYTPFGVAIDPDVRDTVYVGDLWNARLRSLNIASGASGTYVGSGTPFRPPNDDLTVGSSAATLATLRDPYYATSMGGDLFFTDVNSDRIKKVDMVTGLVTSEIADGNGASTEGPAATTKVQILYGLTSYGDMLYFTDGQGGTSNANRNCQIRGWNSSDTDTTVFGKFITNGWVATVAGNYVEGCQSWDAGDEGDLGINVSMTRPMGVGVDDSGNMVFSLFDDDCVMHMDTTGAVTTLVGTCGSSGDSDDTLLNAGLIDRPSEIEMDPRFPTNFFLADQSDQDDARVLYVNNSATDVQIGNVIIGAGRMKSLFSPGARQMWGIAAHENQICYSSGQYEDARYGRHNVTCRDRDTPFLSPSLVVGNSDGTVDPAKRAFGLTSEGATVTSTIVPLYAPRGLEFDNDGNLYIVERGTHTIRFVKKWYP